MSGKGFTEAELLAAAWSKAQKEKKSEDIPNNRNRSFLHRGDGGTNERKTTRDRDRDRNRDNSRLKSHHSRRRSRSRSRSRNRGGHRDCSERAPPSYSPYRGQAQSGRDSPTYSPYRTDTDLHTTAKERRVYSRSRSYGERRSRSRRRSDYDRRGRSRSYSRSWSRSRSRDSVVDPVTLARLPPPLDPVRPDHDDRDSRGRRRHISSGRARDRRRSRSRSHSSSSNDGPTRDSASQWIHDKYMRALDRDSPEPERRAPKDYRPPSPTWVSRAGGVAIMRK